MRYLIYSLVIANLAFWAWYPRPPAVQVPGDGLAPNPPGVESLVLLSERGKPEPQPAAEPEPAPPAPVESVQETIAVEAGDAAPEVEPGTEQSRNEPGEDELVAAVAPAEPEPAPLPEKRCQTLGPFASSEDQASVAQLLGEAGLEGKSRTSDVQEQIGYWVYLPAMSGEEAKRIAKHLAERGVTDYFIGKQNYISLGAFSDKTTAHTRRDAIAAMGYEPHLDPRFKTRTVYWLDVEEPPEQQLTEAQWDEIEGRFPDARRQPLSCE